MVSWEQGPWESRHRLGSILGVFICWGYHNKLLWSGWLKQHLFSYVSRAQKSKIKVLAELVSTELFLLDLQMVIFSLSLHIIFPPCMSVSKSPYKDSSHPALGPTLMTLFYLNLHL